MLIASLLSKKGLNDERKSIIIKESTKGTSLHVIANLCHYVDIFRQFLRDQGRVIQLWEIQDCDSYGFKKY